MTANPVVILENSKLVPAAWRFRAGQGPVWAFNPTILPDGRGWICAYRLVFRDQARRIAICRLDSEFVVVPGSPLPLSDLLRPERSCEYSEVDRTWFADPRLYRLNGRLLMYWNSGWHDSANVQFLQALDDVTLRPVDAPRPLQRDGKRQTIEKNWMLFGDGPFFALYSSAGQTILQGDIEVGPAIQFVQVARTDWDPGAYVREFGALRGGAPPQRLDGGYYCFCHSVSPAPNGYRYTAGVYRFAAEMPFLPTHRPMRPLPLPNPFGIDSTYPRLNPAVGEVLYPSGAIFDRGNWVISYGINDERCAIATIPHAEIQSCLCSIEATSWS